jgi:polysaccharide export outer membrane protein
MRFTKMLGLAAPLLLAGCANDIASAPTRATDTAPAQDDVYRVASDDKLRIDVFGEANLSGEYVVGSDNAIQFPLLGTVPVAGKSLAEVQQLIGVSLGGKFLTNPRVTVSILEFRPFYVLGEVNGQGQYPYRPGMTVLTAIATARGFTYRANKERVIIQHQGEAEEHIYPLTPALKIKPGDTIRVQERFF